MGNPTATLYTITTVFVQKERLWEIPRRYPIAVRFSKSSTIRRIRCPDSRYWQRCGGASRSLIAIYCGLVYFRIFLYLCIMFSRPFAVFLIRLLIMWIPEFFMVYKIRGGGERAGWVMSPVGNDRVGT